MTGVSATPGRQAPDVLTRVSVTPSAAKIYNAVTNGNPFIVDGQFCLSHSQSHWRNHQINHALGSTNTNVWAAAPTNTNLPSRTYFLREDHSSRHVWNRQNNGKMASVRTYSHEHVRAHLARHLRYRVAAEDIVQLPDEAPRIIIR